MQELDVLVRAAQGGDSAAYEEIVRRFQTMAIGYARSLLGDFHLAEDAAQEAFVQAYLELCDLQQPLAFVTWFRRIVFKHCDRIRRRKREAALAPEKVENIVDASAQPTQQLEDIDAKERLQKAIETLPDAEREATKLFYLHSFSQKEIAAHLKLPISTVNYRLHAARQRLKKELLHMTTSKIQAGTTTERDISAAVRKQIEILQQVHGELATGIEPIFSLAMSREVGVEVASATQKTYAEYVESLSRHTCLYYFNVEPVRGWVSWNISLPLTLASTHSYHDDEALQQEAEARTHIAIDMLATPPYQIGMINRIIGLAAMKFEKAWEPVLPIKTFNFHIETTPMLTLKNAELTDAKEMVIQVDLEVKVAGLSGLVMNLCYPVFMLEEALPNS